MSDTPKPKSTAEQTALLIAVIVALAGNIVFIQSLAYLISTLLVAFVFVPKAGWLRSPTTLVILVIGSSLVSLLMGATAMGCRCMEGSLAAGIFRETLATALVLSLASLGVLVLLRKPPSLQGPLLFFQLIHPVIVGILIRIGALHYGAHAFVSSL
jgi:hypothetical protein